MAGDTRSRGAGRPLSGDVLEQCEGDTLRRAWKALQAGVESVQRSWSEKKQPRVVGISQSM